MFYRSLTLLFLCSLSVLTSAAEVPIYDFPLKAYSQDVNEYLSPDNADYATSLLKPAYQQAQLRQFYNHYYSTAEQGLSPWSERMVKAVLPVVKQIELDTVKDYDNQDQSDDKKHYGMNFKEHDEFWLQQIKRNMNWVAIESISFNPRNRAIAITNTFARALPEQAPDFYHFSLAGQGFPFDNLEESAVWAGTPLYVLSVSQDKSWSLVLTPDEYFAWVKSSDIAYVSNQFIAQWQKAAQSRLVAITETGASVVNKH